MDKSFIHIIFPLDYAKGFGGKFGVQAVQDKSAVGWDHVENVEKHQSQRTSDVNGEAAKVGSRVGKIGSQWEQKITEAAAEPVLVSS